MSQKWFVNRAGERFGPYSWAELTAYVRAGRVLPDDDVWTEGKASWVKARRVSGLFDSPPGSPSSRESRSMRLILLSATGALLVLALIVYLVSREDARSRRPFAPLGSGSHVEKVSQIPSSPAPARAPVDEPKPPSSPASTNPSGAEFDNLILRVKADAERGRPESVLALALAHKAGTIENAHPQEAIKLLEKASDSGNADAMAYLADEYESGLLVPYDPQKAKALREKAAKAGSQLARWALGQD